MVCRSADLILAKRVEARVISFAILAVDTEEVFSKINVIDRN